MIEFNCILCGNKVTEGVTPKIRLRADSVTNQHNSFLVHYEGNDTGGYFVCSSCYDHIRMKKSVCFCSKCKEQRFINSLSLGCIKEIGNWCIE